MDGKGLQKLADTDKESEYGYVFGVSGPGKNLVTIGSWSSR